MRALLIVVAALSTACASTGAVPKPFPTPTGTTERPAATLPNGGVAPTATPVSRTSGYEVSGTALSLRGVPYRNGGDNTNGFDCSGLVWYVFGQHGVAVPRTVAEQFKAGTNVAASELREGDLVFFTTTAPGASHVGIVVGGDSFIHAPAVSGVVRVEHLGASYWSSRFVGARRITP